MPCGGGLIGADQALHLRALAGFGRHPNVGAVLLIGSDTPKIEALAREIAAAGKPLAAVCLDDCGHDILTLSDRALRAGARLAREISRQRRVPADIGQLLVGLELGRSDPSSGIVANPLIGAITDALVDAGASAVFRGEHTLAEAAGRLLGQMIGIAEGTLTWGEVLDDGDEVVSRLGEAL
jgi:altronate dehydratase large subunit